MSMYWGCRYSWTKCPGFLTLPMSISPTRTPLWPRTPLNRCFPPSPDIFLSPLIALTLPRVILRMDCGFLPDLAITSECVLRGAMIVQFCSIVLNDSSWVPTTTSRIYVLCVRPPFLLLPRRPYRITFSQKSQSTSIHSIRLCATYRRRTGSVPDWAIFIHTMFYHVIRLDILVYNSTLPKTESQAPDCIRRNEPTHCLVLSSR